MDCESDSDFWGAVQDPAVVKNKTSMLNLPALVIHALKQKMPKKTLGARNVGQLVTVTAPASPLIQTGARCLGMIIACACEQLVHTHV